jgi:hypothetical protein
MRTVFWGRGGDFGFELSPISGEILLDGLFVGYWLAPLASAGPRQKFDVDVPDHETLTLLKEQLRR